MLDQGYTFLIIIKRAFCSLMPPISRAIRRLTVLDFPFPFVLWYFIEKVAFYFYVELCVQIILLSFWCGDIISNSVLLFLLLVFFHLRTSLYVYKRFKEGSDWNIYCVVLKRHIFMKVNYWINLLWGMKR